MDIKLQIKFSSFCRKTIITFYSFLVSVCVQIWISITENHSASLKSSAPSSSVEHENPIMGERTLPKLHAQKRGGNEYWESVTMNLCMCLCFCFYCQYFTKLYLMYAAKATFSLYIHNSFGAYLSCEFSIFVEHECPEMYKFHIYSRNHLSEVELLMVTLAYLFLGEKPFLMF